MFGLNPSTVDFYGTLQNTLKKNEPPLLVPCSEFTSGGSVFEWTVNGTMANAFALLALITWMIDCIDSTIDYYYFLLMKRWFIGAQ